MCNLYSATSNFNVTYHQPISDNGDPTDAQFFVQQEKLFLAILFHERSVSVRLNKISSQLRLVGYELYTVNGMYLQHMAQNLPCQCLNLVLFVVF